MLIDEFKKRTGMNPTDAEFNEVINVMYLESGQDMDKDRFCEDYKKHHDSELLNIFYNRCDKLSDKLDALRAERLRMVDFLLKKAEEFSDDAMYQNAVALVGIKKVIERKIKLHLKLTNDDEQWIIGQLLRIS